MAFELGEVLITADAIEQRVQTLAAKINSDYSTGRLHLVVALKGACLFAADLARAIRRDLSFDFVQASSYGSGVETSGKVVISRDLALDIGGSHTLLVEDIVDSGHTAEALLAHLVERGAESVRVATLLSKPDRRVVDVKIDYLGFEIPDRFVVGYGMDHNERYRNLADIHALHKIDDTAGKGSLGMQARQGTAAASSELAADSAGGIIPPPYPRA